MSMSVGSHFPTPTSHFFFIRKPFTIYKPFFLKKKIRKEKQTRLYFYEK